MSPIRLSIFLFDFFCELINIIDSQQAPCYFYDSQQGSKTERDD